MMDKSQYGDPSKYEEHLLEQYKLYLTMADKISERRAQANQFYGTVLAGILTIIIPVVTTLLESDTPVDPKIYGSIYSSIGFIGIVLCWIWYNNINSYKQLNSGKFLVVHEMEKLLPFSCYDVEWDKLGRGEKNNLYFPLTHIELWVPRIISVPFILVAFIGFFSLAQGDSPLFTIVCLVLYILLFLFIFFFKKLPF